MATWARRGLLCVLVLAGRPAWAAGWSSGGGELLRDAHNPWFVENTKSVHYCVEADEGNFGVPLADAEAIVSSVIAAWKAEFAVAEAPAVGLERPTYGVGSQNFVAEACTDQTDLRVQLGVLDAEQKAFLGDAGRIVGIAVRTDYDEVNLRAKGFIYIAPERGPLRLSGVDGRYWSTNGTALFYALAHEFGHVFGLQHSPNSYLMDEFFGERLVSHGDVELPRAKDRLYVLKRGPAEGTIYGAYAGMLNCEADFFGFPHEFEVLHWSLGGDNVSTLSVEARADAWSAGPLRPVGQAVLDKVYRYVAEPGIAIVLNPKQRVFSGQSAGALRSYGTTYEIRSGFYSSADGAIRRPIFADLNPRQARFSGTTSQDITADLFGQWLERGGWRECGIAAQGES